MTSTRSRNLCAAALSITHAGHTRLTDLGFALDNRHKSSIWRSGPAGVIYAPPEFLLQGVDCSRSDCWRAGVLCYHLIVGRPLLLYTPATQAVHRQICDKRRLDYAGAAEAAEVAQHDFFAMLRKRDKAYPCDWSQLRAALHCTTCSRAPAKAVTRRGREVSVLDDRDDHKSGVAQSCGVLGANLLLRRLC